MSRFAPMGTRRLACGAIAAALLATAACSGTVEASYRPPPPPPPTPAPTTVAPTPTAAPTTQSVAAAACGPDEVAVQVGDVQSDASSRAVPLLIRTRGASACGVANPVGVELVDAAGTPLTTRLQVADLPAGRTAVDLIPPAPGAAPAQSAPAPSGAAPSAAAPSGPPPTGPPATGSPSTGSPSPIGVTVWLQWRAEPSVRTADPATDCVDATGLLLTLADAARPISVAAKLKACDGGTVYVSPAEPGIG